MPAQTASNTGSRRGPYAKTAQVRKTILLACIEAFGEAGFHGATMKDIAQRAGISQTGLLHHFPDKAGLLIEVLQERDEQMSQLMSAHEGHTDFLHAQLELVRDNEHRPGLLQLHTMISAEATAEDHPAHDLYRERYDNLRTYLTAIFEALRDRGDLRVSTDPRVLANLFIGALDGLQLLWLYNPAEVDIVESLTALIDTLLPETA